MTKTLIWLGIITGAGLTLWLKPPKIIDRCYKNTTVILTAHYFAEWDDHYFRLRKGGYFEDYWKTFNFITHNRYTGSYYQKNDTLFLTYCDGISPDSAKFNNKAYIDLQKKVITFFAKKKGWDFDFPIESTSLRNTAATK
jgi:hypothetical protein